MILTSQQEMDADILNYLLSDNDEGKKAAETPIKPKPPFTSTRRAARLPLTTKDAVQFLLNGTLQSKICRYCLNVTSQLNDVSKVMQIAGKGEVLYKVAVSDMIATVYPYQIKHDVNLPNKICDRCLNHTLTSYLFTQRCEQTERALSNCLNEIYEKFEKLDPLEYTKKRGRKKLLINHNILYASHKYVIDYAEPMINLINRGSGLLNNTIKPVLNHLECPKCWQVMPNLESLLNHEKSHPSTMWYHCRLCGSSFAKLHHLKRHLKSCNYVKPSPSNDNSKSFECKDCGTTTDNYMLHLQHIEKHKFKKVLDHVMQKRMNDLCSVCLNKGRGMMDLDKTVALHGGCPELSGDRNLYSILGSTLPDITPQSLTGTKICKKCYDNTMHAYVFINQSLYNRRRLNTCVTAMLDNLKQIKEPENSVFVEIADNLILPVRDVALSDDDSFSDEDEDLDDEGRMKVDVLEDEFRIKSSDESDDDSKDVKLKQEPSPSEMSKPIRETSTYNGFQSTVAKAETDFGDVCEFLTFKKVKKRGFKPRARKFICPYCDKRFLNEYFLSTHVTKHSIKNSNCNVCSKEFKTKFILREHVKMDHLRKEASYISCYVCGRAYNDFKKYKQHKKFHLVKQCHLCDKLFKNQHYFDSHMQRHALKFQIQKRKIYNCSFCEKEFWSENKLSVHVNKVHLQVKYSCDMCEQQFYTSENVSSHKIIHSVYSKEKCQICDKTLKCRKALVLHLKKHIG